MEKQDFCLPRAGFPLKKNEKSFLLMPSGRHLFHPKVKKNYQNRFLERSNKTKMFIFRLQLLNKHILKTTQPTCTNKQTAISTTAPATLDLERLFFLQDTSVLLPVLNTSSISINHYILSISITDKQRTQSLLKEQRAEFYII